MVDKLRLLFFTRPPLQKVSYLLTLQAIPVLSSTLATGHSMARHHSTLKPDASVPSISLHKGSNEKAFVQTTGESIKEARLMMRVYIQ